MAKSKRVNLAYEVAANHRIDAYLEYKTADYLTHSDNIIEAAYEKGFNGCFVDGPGSPWWARTVAKYEKDKFMATKDKGTRLVEDLIPFEEQSKWQGKRACHWNAWTRRHPRALKGSQDYGNCTSWMWREMLNCERASDVENRGELHAIQYRIGTAVLYGSRGHGGQGSALSTLGNAAVKIGLNEERSYEGIPYDFTEENTDESYGNSWGSRGVPSEVKAAVKNEKLEEWATTTDSNAILDVLDRGHFLGHGSMLTANPNGKLVTGLRSIGGHAQAVIGYDDTDEFRKWCQDEVGQRITEPVVHNDQSWGSSFNTFPDAYWPSHLWGDRPEGVWVIKLSDLMRIVRQWNDCIACSNVLGFPLREMPDWGSSSYL